MSEWISVKDRLPDDNYIQYLVTDGCDYDIADYSKGCFACDIVGGCFVTHWMLLPDLPKDNQ